MKTIFKTLILSIILLGFSELQAQDCSNFCVWPGDVNNNGIVNHFDVLPLGLAQGETGPFRTDSNVDWDAKEASDWTNFFSNGANYKHADSNGDGFCDEFDIFPIANNFKEINSLYTGAEEGNNISGPDLAATLNQTTYTDGQTITVTISLGSAANPVSNLAGLAFSLDIDTAYVQEVLFPITWNFGFLGPANSILTFDKYEPGVSDRIDLAFAKSDGSTINGFGDILTVQMVIIDDLSQRFSNPQPYEIKIKDVLGIDTNETDLLITKTGDEATLITTSINEIGLDDNWKIYPNPIKDKLNIISDNETIEQIEIFDAQGKSWYRNHYDSENIPFHEPPSGLYIIVIHTRQNTYSHKVLKL